MFSDLSAEEKLKRTKFLVEATHTETFMLWERWSKTTLYKIPGWSEHEWEQINPGTIVKVGTLDKRPVNISLFWYKIDGVLVCFWEMISQVTDALMVEKWLDKHFKGRCDSGRRPATCDAMNFSHCIFALKELKEL